MSLWRVRQSHVLREEVKIGVARELVKITEMNSHILHYLIRNGLPTIVGCFANGTPAVVILKHSLHARAAIEMVAWQRIRIFVHSQANWAREFILNTLQYLAHTIFECRHETK